MIALTQQRLKQLIDYDQSTGLISRKVITSNRIKTDKPAGSIDHYGYRLIRIDGKQYKAHRLIWLYVYGEWPSGDVDHINGIKDDNRIINLRTVGKGINNRNLHSAKRNNKSGFLGVSVHGGRYHARTKVNGKDKHLGSYQSPEQAHSAYLSARAALEAAWGVKHAER